jgi:hypothetical protein
MYFADGTIYSYGSHFPIAKHVTDKNGYHCVLFTTRSYSNTTAKHMSLVSYAIPDGVPIYHVTHPTNRVSESDLDDMRSRHAGVVMQVRNSKNGWGLSSIDDVRDEMVAFKAAFHLKGGIPAPEDFSSKVKRWEEWNAKTDERRRLANERAAEKCRDSRIRQMKNFLGLGEDDVLTFEPKWDRAYLHVRPGEDVARTTMGAEVPVEHIKKIAPLVLALIREGRTYKKNGHTIHLGNYTLDEIMAEGMVIAGCHRFDKEEIIRFAKEIGVEA